MNRDKAAILERFVSTKVLAGPSASPASSAARAALRNDPDYVELRSRLEASGFFAPAPGDYAWRIALNVAIASLGWLGVVAAPSLGLRAICVIAVGVAMVQSSFLAHDAAHGALTRRSWLVELIGQAHSTVIAGYAFGYFRRSHDLHHFHTNEDGIDPDCLSDLFSVHEPSARRKSGLGRLVTRYQVVLMPVLYPLWALAMKWDGLVHALRAPRRHRRDLATLGLHVAVWLVVPAMYAGPATALASYIACNAVAGLYLGAVIPVNHVGMSYLSSGHGLSFLEQQLATCRDIRSPRRRVLAALFDWWFIGLNRQIEHHLFPWAPVCRLPRGAAILREFCRERGLPYHETCYREATRVLFQHMARVARASEVSALPGLEAQPPGV
jgi:fatty acid desaturase